MTAQAVQNPFPTFTGSDGQPLAGGYVYFGQASQDPRQYPVTVYYDQAMTIVAAQPLHTTAGFIYRNGSPANVWLPNGVAYSVMVLDSGQAQVSYTAAWQGVADEAAAAAAAAAQPYVTAAAASATAAAASATAAAASASAALANGRIYASQAAAQADGTLANGSYYAVPQASPSTTFYDLYIKVSGVASTYVNTYPSMTAVQDQILKLTASVGDVYALGTLTAYGTTAPNTSTYPGGFTDTFFPTGATTTRGYLQDFSVRTAGGAGAGQIIVLTPDPMSPYDYDVVAVVAVAVADGINTFQGSTIYTSALPVGSRVGYRIVSGGTPRYVAGAGKRISTNAQTAGTAMSGNLLDYVNTVAVAFNLRPAVTDSLDQRLTRAEAGTNQFGIDAAAVLGSNVTATSTPTGNTGLAVTASLSTGDWVYALAPTTAPCILESVTLPIPNPFTQPDISLFDVRVAIGEVNAAGQIIVTHLYTVKVAVGKTNVITGFGALLLPTGAYVMVQTPSAFAPLNYAAGLNGFATYTVNQGAPLTVGATVALAAYFNTPIFSYSVRQVANGLGPRVSTLESIQTLLNGTTNPVALERTEFPGVALPTGWVASGAWVVNNGITPPAAGGWGVKALNANYTALWKHNQIARVTINSADTITGICQSPPENSGGAVLMIDGVAGKLRLYQWNDTGAAGVLQTETALPAALTVGRDYVLELQKVGFALTGTFKDTVSQASCTVTLADTSGSYVMAHGKCGPIFISATTPPKYQWLEYLAPYPRKCRALIIADSIGEGAYLGAANPTWVQQVANARAAQNDVVIAPRAGDETPNFLLRKVNDLDLWLPQFAVLAMGTNDTDQTIWRTNTATLIAKAVANGAEPILCTQVPNTGAQALRTAMNTDIRSGYFGRYRYIDMAIPVSAGNAGVAWNAAYDSGDGIHPNAAGQNLMYAQALIAAPFLTR